MSDLQFDESSFTSRTIMGEPQTPGMVKSIIKVGIVKNPKTAALILKAVAIVCFLASAVILFFTFSGI